MTRNNNILPIMVALIIGLLLLISFVGCKTTQPIAQTRDSIRIEYKHDSIYLYERDSVFVDKWRANDTVFVTTTKWQVRYRDKVVELHDTIATQRTDTVQVKYIPQYYYATSRGFWILLVILIVAIGIKAIKIYFKLKGL